MWLHCSLPVTCTSIASEYSSHKRTKYCKTQHMHVERHALVPKAYQPHSQWYRRHTHTLANTQNQNTEGWKNRLNTTNTHTHTHIVHILICTHKELQAYTDLICLLLSSWKRLHLRQCITSAWEEMTGTGLPLSLFLSLLKPLFIFSLLFYIFPFSAPLTNESLNLWNTLSLSHTHMCIWAYTHTNLKLYKILYVCMNKIIHIRELNSNAKGNTRIHTVKIKQCYCWTQGVDHCKVPPLPWDYITCCKCT